MTWLKETAWPWLKKWWLALVAGILVILGVLGLVKVYKGRLGKLKDELVVAKATGKINELRAARTSVEERVGEKDEALAIIDRRLAENKRSIVEAYEGGEGLTDEEVLAEFAHLGI